MALSFTRDIQEEIPFLPSQEAERLRISELSVRKLSAILKWANSAPGGEDCDIARFSLAVT